MNDLHLLKEFRAGLGTDPGAEHLDASWEALSERIGMSGASNVIRARPRGRRWAVAAAVAATVAVLALALPAVLPSGAPGGPGQAAAVSFSTEGSYIVAVIKDPQADSEELKAAFAEHGLDITLQLLPVSPSFVGKFVFEGDSGGNGTGSGIETLYDENADCTTPGGLSCPIGLRIPLDFNGHADLALGRAAEPGERYASTNDAFAQGEALHCSGLRGMTVRQAQPVLVQRGLTAVWRSNDPAIDRNDGIDPSTIADEYVTDALPVAEGQVLVWTSPNPPAQPEPGTPLAEYFARLERGC